MAGRVARQEGASSRAERRGWARPWRGPLAREEGAKVALADLQLDKAQAVADSINAEHGARTATAFALKLDVTRRRSAGRARHRDRRRSQAMDGLSVLVNNAGISLGGGDIEQCSLDDFRLTMSGQRRQRVPRLQIRHAR